MINIDEIQSTFDTSVEKANGFKCLHKNNWFYTIARETEEDSGEHTYIKVGGYGSDDIQVKEITDEYVIVNYMEPFNKFASLEEAYMFHNWLWSYYEEQDM